MFPSIVHSFSFVCVELFTWIYIYKSSVILCLCWILYFKIVVDCLLCLIRHRLWLFDCCLFPSKRLIHHYSWSHKLTNVNSERSPLTDPDWASSSILRVEDFRARHINWNVNCLHKNILEKLCPLWNNRFVIVDLDLPSPVHSMLIRSMRIWIRIQFKLVMLSITKANL